MPNPKPKNVVGQAQNLIGANFTMERPVQKIIWSIIAGISVLYAAAAGANSETLLESARLLNNPHVFVPVLLGMIAVWREVKR